MATKYEKIGKNEAKLTIEIDNKVFLEYEDKVYNKQKNRFNIPGFRKGHATKDMIYKMYGREVFFEEAVNDCINGTYYDAVLDYKNDILSNPEINIVEASTDKNLIYEAKVAIKPEFTLPKYKGIDFKKTPVEVKDEDVDKRIRLELEKNATLTTVDRPVQNGDEIRLDFDGSVDGKRFDGGKSENFLLSIGSHTFIDGFEDQIIGKKLDEDFDVNVTFPTVYANKDLAGKPAVFKCKVRSIKEKHVPELDDEFVGEVSEYKDVAEYKKHIKEDITKEKEISTKESDKGKIIQKIVDDTKIDLSDKAIDQGVKDIERNIERRLYSQGLNFETYLRMINKSKEDFEKEQRDVAKNDLKRVLVLDEIAKAENIEADDKMVDDYLTTMSAQYGMAMEDMKKTLTSLQIKNIKEDLKYPAVANFLYDNAKLK